MTENQDFRLFAAAFESIVKSKELGQLFHNQHTPVPTRL
jgi:hypothetical protein